MSNTHCSDLAQYTHTLTQATRNALCLSHITRLLRSKDSNTLACSLPQQLNSIHSGTRGVVPSLRGESRALGLHVGMSRIYLASPSERTRCSPGLVASSGPCRASPCCSQHWNPGKPWLCLSCLVCRLGQYDLQAIISAV